ncbi:MAG: hypothetical protein ACPHAN_13325, partial [Pseudomonadales bacterium]
NITKMIYCHRTILIDVFKKSAQPARGLATSYQASFIPVPSAVSFRYEYETRTYTQNRSATEDDAPASASD